MITILRKPIQSAEKKCINFVSGGQLERAQKELKYDDIFHLYVNFTLKNGKGVGIEKMHVSIPILMDSRPQD